MSYCTEADVQARTARSFDADSTITDTQLTSLIADMSALVDQVDRDSTANSDDKKAATIAACAESVEGVYNETRAVKQEDLIKIVEYHIFSSPKKKFIIRNVEPDGDDYYQ